MRERGRTRRASHGSFIVDGRGTILGFDEGMESLTEWPAIDVVGQQKDLRVSDDGGLRAGRTVPLYEGQVPVGGESGPLRITLNRRDGRQLEVDCTVRPLHGPGERMIVTVLRVLSRSARRSATDDLRSVDELTGLGDHDAFRARLSDSFRAAVGTARPLAVILADVDHLREINDRSGRNAGDDVLRKIAGILRVTADEERHIARLGADDFAILLPGGGRGEARQLAATLRSTVERFRFFSDDPTPQPRVTISLGAASFPADADTEEELMERAQEALDEARAMGRNRVWCYLRRPRVPLQVPVFFDSSEPLLVGYTRDLSPSGIFIQTTENIDVGMRCALAFPIPGHEGKVHVVGRVVRTVLPNLIGAEDIRIPGLGIEFERFGGNKDRRAIERFLHRRQATSLRPENGIFSIS